MKTKKFFYKTGAFTISLLLFFNVCIYNTIPAHAFTIPWGAIAKWIALQALGHYAAEPLLDEIDQKTGWHSADIQVDEDGNVIISEAQMQELKDTIEEHLADEYGTWTLTSEYKTFEEGMAALHYTNPENHIQLRRLLDDTTCTWLSWTGQYGNAVGAPPGCYWVSSGIDNTISFYNDQLRPVETKLACRAGLPWYTVKTTSSNISSRTNITGSGSSIKGSCYAGPDHVVFRSTVALQMFLDDGNEMVTPTYTGGDLIITREQLKNYGVSDNDIPGGGTGDNGDNGDNTGNTGENPALPSKPTTEMEWLELIYYRLGDILDYLKESEKAAS